MNGRFGMTNFESGSWSDLRMDLRKATRRPSLCGMTWSTVRMSTSVWGIASLGLFAHPDSDRRSKNRKKKKS
ncbi:F-box protein [Pyrus ussuriensis x Pyrus communis]|uniref:F-box protein n=1 Tax=Pyrus ussuriensis x Pyrus communis TaxID=2448454 RepID=A0A5N5HJK4_9ROSA|nr:F-box protein [Pyrus ussuriensis x Pyrus communis]